MTSRTISLSDVGVTVDHAHPRIFQDVSSTNSGNQRVNDHTSPTDHLPLFCKSEHTRIISELLSSIQTRNSTSSSGRNKEFQAICVATPDEIRFIVEESNSFQAVCYLKASLFQLYCCSVPSLMFRISLSTTLECLHIFKEGYPTLFMAYDPSDAKFALTLENNGVVTDCLIQTMVTDPPINFSAKSSRNSHATTFQSCVGKAIMKSDSLRDAISEMEWLGGGIVTIGLELSDNEWTLVMSSAGDYGRGSVEFPSTSNSFLSFECLAEGTTSFSYSLISLLRTTAALRSSSETLFRIDEFGMLSMQLAVQNIGHSEPNFIDFIICPVIDDVNNDVANE